MFTSFTHTHSVAAVLFIVKEKNNLESLIMSDRSRSRAKRNTNKLERDKSEGYNRGNGRAAVAGFA